MKNFLFEHEEAGLFFVQCDNELECEKILVENDFNPEECILLDVLEDEEAEILGYDTY